MALDRVAQPFYDNSSKEYHDKNYRQILFTSGRSVQCRELTGIGSFSHEYIKEVAGLLYKDGTVLNGCNVRSMDRTPRTDYPDAIPGLNVGTISMNGGRIFIDGSPFEIEFTKFPNFSKDTIPIKLTGTEIIYVEILDTVVTAIEDPTLLDPASGYDNYEAPGAHRLQRIARYISTAHRDYNTTGNIRVPIVELLDGKIIYEAAKKAETNESEDSVSSETNILDLLSQRTYETSGDYLVNGYRIKTAPCLDNTKVAVQVTPGIAYIAGKRIELQSSFTGYIDKISVTSIVQGEEKPVEWLKKINDLGIEVDDLDPQGKKQVKRNYKLSLSPVAAVTEVAVPVIGKRQMIYNPASISYITGLSGAVNKILKCYIPKSPEPGEAQPDVLPDQLEEFIEGVDFRFENQGILWLGSGHNPSTVTGGIAGNQFFVTFLYKPNLLSTDYHIEFASEKRETTLRLPISAGIAKIPDAFLNPTVKSVKNPHAPVGEDFAVLENNKQWYHTGNEIHVSTKTYPYLPLRVNRRSNTNTDSIGISGAVIRNLRFYSEQGVVDYTADNGYEPKPDFRFYSDTGNIEWLGTNRPPVGEVYIVEAEMGNSVYIDYGSKQEEILVSFTYENLSDMYSNEVHDSYIVIHDNVKIYRSETGGDNITLSYEVARSRTTTAGLDKQGIISFYHGTVIDQYNNLSPVVPTTSLPIADLFIKPTTAKEYRILSQNNYRMRMTDLRDMFDRVKDIEYNISLNDLEKEAESKLPGQVLRGVFTDSFMNIKKSDDSMVWSFIKSLDNQAIPLITEGRLSPNYRRYSTDLTINPAKTTAGLFGNVYMLSKNYTQEVWLKQPFGTMVRSAAEGLDLMECFPSFNIDPDSDQFVDHGPDVIDADPNAEALEGIVGDSINHYIKNCYVFDEHTNTASLVFDKVMNLPSNPGSVTTVQFWMYADRDDRWQDIFTLTSKTGNDNHGAAVSFYSTVQGKVFGIIPATDRPKVIYGLPSEEFVGHWRHITVQLKCKADNQRDHLIFINGEKQNTTFYQIHNDMPDGLDNQSIYKKFAFGNNIQINGYSGRTGKNKGFFSGKIADVRIYNRALSVKEIKDSMVNVLSGNENGLIGYWKAPVEGSKIVNSAIAGTKPALKIKKNIEGIPNTAGYEAYHNGTVSSVVLNLMSGLTGQKTDGRGVVIKNVMDMTAGNIPQEQTDLILDPTGKSTLAVAWNQYVTKDVTKGAQRNAASLGGIKFDTYNVQKTWYEKVVDKKDEALGEFISDLQSVANLRQRIIQVKGKGFLPNTDMISITFDGIPVKLHKYKDYNEATDGKPSTGTNNVDGFWKTNDKGEFRCGFLIPKDVPIGVREVKLTAPGGISLKALYWGAGIKASKLKLTQENQTIKWEPKTEIIGQEQRNKEGWILLDGWTCRSRCGTTPLCQTFYVNDSSLTKPIIKDIGTNSDVFISSVDVFFRTAGECPDCIAGFVELTDSGVPKSDSGAGPSRFVGGVNVFDSKTINMTEGDPARGTAPHNIKWPNLVPLDGGKGYGFIVGSTDGNTTMWVASIENSSKNVDAATGISVISEPDRGILLSSPNGQTWAVYHYEDMKYTFYVANFFSDPKLSNAPSALKPNKALRATGKVSYIEYNEVDIKTKSNNNLSAMNFFIYEVNSKNSNDGSGFVNYEYSSFDQITGKWSSWKGFTPGMTVFLEKSVQKIKIRVSLYSFNPYSTPVVSRDASLTCGQFILPTTYTSVTGAVGNWNKAEIYIDKFFDESKSEIELYISPDQGYSWKHMAIPVDVVPILQSDDRYNGEKINQFHYKLELTVDTPVIEDITIKTDAVVGGFPTAGEYEFAVALVDGNGNESKLSNKMKKNITNTNSAAIFNVKFDPNASGFRIYARLTNQPKLTLFYDSTADAKLRNDLAKTESTNEMFIGKEGVRFPKEGVVLIDNEYIKYTDIEKKTDSGTGEIYYRLHGSGFDRNITHNGIQSILGAHEKGSLVQLVNEGSFQIDSPTAVTTGLWRFPGYARKSNFDWNFFFQATDALKYRSELQDVVPNYNEDLPANYTSENVTFRIEMKDKNGDLTVETLDKVPNAGRVMITTGYEAF